MKLYDKLKLKKDGKKHRKNKERRMLDAHSWLNIHKLS
jgi:hypothetical protein